MTEAWRLLKAASWWLGATVVLLLVLATAAFVWWVRLDAETSSPQTLFSDKQDSELVVAAEEGDLEAIDRLIELGADVDAVGLHKATPLFRALVAQNKPGFSALLDAGADPNTQHRRGDTLAHRAAGMADPFFLKKLLEHGADPDAINTGHPYSPGLTPIFYAIKSIKERPENVRVLIAAGADINYQDPDGLTPMHTANMCHNFEITYDLLVAGADYRIKSNDGRDAVEFRLRGRKTIAADQQKWFEKVVEFLEAQGVDLSAPDNT